MTTCAYCSHDIDRHDPQARVHDLNEVVHEGCLWECDVCTGCYDVAATDEYRAAHGWEKIDGSEYCGKCANEYRYVERENREWTLAVEAEANRITGGKA